MRTTTLLIVANVLFLCLTIGAYFKKTHHAPIQQYAPIEELANPISNQPVLPPIRNSITVFEPSYMNYEQTINQLKKWNSEAPELTEVGKYGRTTRGKDLYYIRVVNKRNQTVDRPKVLITACIHGNEPLASSTTMWHIGALLNRYGKDDAITQLIDSRDIYFVPVVSPDSYPSSRIVDGVDPNRDFPSPSQPNHRSVVPVKAIQELFDKIKPNAVISGHTWGRVYLTPYGDTMQNCPDHESIMTVINKMKELSGYRAIRACDMYGVRGLNNPPIRTIGNNEGLYGSPIYGTEVDWYYRRGAFALVCEFGTHQRIPTDEDTRAEFNKTFSAFLLFLREAPLVHLK